MSSPTVKPLEPRRCPDGFTTTHHVGQPPTSFRNPWPSYQGTSLSTVFRTRFGPGKNLVPVPADRLGLVQVCKPDFENPPPGLKATWIGHASFLIESTARPGASRGMRLLVDPVWSERVGPYGLVGPVRFTPPPCTIEELPEIDAICISHDHYDHLDSETLKQLMIKQDGRICFFCALGVKSVLTGLGIGIKADQVSEMDWWDGCSISTDSVGSIDLICAPAQHRSGRTPWNFDGTLWCSWIFREAHPTGKKLFFAGDTGYCHVDSNEQFSHHEASHQPCPAFREIGQLYGPFDLALLPIGCFKPRSVLSGQHSSPEDSLAIHKDVQSKKSIGMHYGTFRGSLSASFEPVTEPVERWRKAAEAAGLKWDVHVGLCDIGSTVAV